MYDLCPCADHPLWEGRLCLSSVWGNANEEVALAVVYKLVSRLDDSKPGTMILIAPEYHHNDFERYMLLVQYIKEDVTDKLNLIGKVQFALSQPRFMFNRSGIDGINNHTS